MTDGVVLPVPPGFDLARSFVMQRTGRNDPTARLEGDRFIKAARTPEGPAAVEIVIDRDTWTARVETWGEGAGWVLARAAAWLGANDDPSLLKPAPGPLARLHAEHRGLRLPRSPFIAELHASFILQQRVTWAEAVGAHHRLSLDYGSDAPGPLGLRLFPDRKVLAGLPRHTYLSIGIDAKRGGALVEAARLGDRVDRLESLEAARAYLIKIPGTGPWTTENLMASGFGDPDAVPPGDVNLPHSVCWALAGETFGSDARMFELLEPYRGQRNRVVRLIHLGGPTRPYVDRGRSAAIAHRPGSRPGPRSSR